MDKKNDLGRNILSYNYQGRTYLLKQMTLRECFELKLGEQVFVKRDYTSYERGYTIGVVNELTSSGFKLIERSCSISDFEINLQIDKYISNIDNNFTEIYRILREEINPLSMEGYLGLLNLLDKTYPMKEDLIVDSTPRRNYKGNIEEDIFYYRQ